MMETYSKARDYVYSQYGRIYNEALHQDAFAHTAAVDSFITLLAISRDLDVEQAKLAALFHDFAKYEDNCPVQRHPTLSALHASHFLKTELAYPTDKIDEISLAIERHSQKDAISDSPLAEALKDADVLARFCEDPKTPLDADRQKRLFAALSELRS